MIIEIANEVEQDLQDMVKHYNLETPQQLIMHGIRLLKVVKAFHDEGFDVLTSRPGTDHYVPLNVWPGSTPVEV